MKRREFILITLNSMKLTYKQMIIKLVKCFYDWTFDCLING